MILRSASYRSVNRLLPLLAVCFLACARSLGPICATATETTNGSVFTSQGMPAVNARVRLIDAKQWLSKVIAGTSVVIESTITDAHGNFALATNPLPPSNLQVDGSNQGILLLDVDKYRSAPDHPLTLTLSAYATLSGAVDTAITAGQLYFGGSVCRTAIDQDGHFEGVNIPPGIYPLIACPQPALIGLVTASAGDSLGMGTMILNPDNIILEDFSQGFDRTILGRILGGGDWFTFLDTTYAGNSILNFQIQSGSDAFDGKSLHVKICLNSSTTYPYGGVGFWIANSDAPGYDFSGLKKLTFMAKGHGTIRVSISTEILDTLAGNWDHFGAQAAMPVNWTKMEIPVDSLALFAGSPAALSGITWPEASIRARRINFEVMDQFTALGDTVEFWLDNIVLEGVSLTSIIR